MTVVAMVSAVFRRIISRLGPILAEELFRFFFFFQPEDGIRVLVRSRGLGDVYKRQVRGSPHGNISLSVTIIIGLDGNIVANTK